MIEERTIRKMEHLVDIIKPLSIQNFFEEVYEKQFLYGKQTINPFLDVLPSIEYFEELIRSTDLRFPTVSLVENGKSIPYRSYTEIMDCAGINANYVNKNRVPEHLEAGGTIVFNNVHLFHPQLRNLKNEIINTFGCTVTGINAYYTPKRAKGFNLHYDNHDVFVFQIEGGKHWRVYDSEKYLPHESEIPERNLQRGEAIFDDFLESGDFLYIPRGFPHEAQTEGTHSLHLTVGLRPIKRINILEEFVKQAATLEKMRETVSKDEFKDPSRLKDSFIDLIQNLDDGSIKELFNRAFEESDSTAMAFDHKNFTIFSLRNY